MFAMVRGYKHTPYSSDIFLAKKMTFFKNGFFTNMASGFSKYKNETFSEISVSGKPSVFFAIKIGPQRGFQTG